jgi:hypothetical protein
MFRFASTEEMLKVIRLEHERKVRRGTLVREALALEQRTPFRVKAGRALVRVGGRLQGEHAPSALREAMADGH